MHLLSNLFKNFILCNFFLQNIYKQYEKADMDEGSSKSNEGCSSLNQDLQSFDFFFDETTREYCCNSCSFRSKLKSKTKVHLRTHSGVKSFQCKFCDTSFSQASILNRHLHTHSGKRPYKCKFCNLSFTENERLKRHLRTHSGFKMYAIIQFKCKGN